MSRPLRVNLVPHKDTGGGISRDIEVLERVLRHLEERHPELAFRLFYHGWRVRRPRSRVRRWLAGLEHRVRKVGARLQGRPVFDLNLHLERIGAAYLGLARIEALIPNPEWFLDDDLQWLPSIDHVLCKTKHAVPIFEERGCTARWIGFTGRDLGPPPDLADLEPRFLHVAGKSSEKGTAAVVDAWRRHPEWPTLTLVQSPKRYFGETADRFDSPANVRYVRRWLTGEELAELQRRHAFHLLPSEAEGFGHVIAEALSACSVVVTTDAPPMNEMVRPDHGVLVPVARQTPMHLGTRYFVDPDALDRRIEGVLSLPRDRWEEMAIRGRVAFESQRDGFRRRLHEYMQDVGTGLPGGGALPSSESRTLRPPPADS